MKDESNKDLNCTVVLKVNSGQISIENPTINGKGVELKEILKLAEKNKDVLVKGEDLHKVLGECLVQQMPCKETEGMQSHENIVMPPNSNVNEVNATQHVEEKGKAI